MSKALYDLGVLDHASWNAGISGGSWYVTAHYLASLQRTTGGLADPAAVIAAIKDRVMYSIFGDYFLGNEVRPSCVCVMHVYVCLSLFGSARARAWFYDWVVLMFSTH